MNEESALNENSVRKLQQIAEAFFDTVNDVNMNSSKDLKSIISILDASCKRNHIRQLFDISNMADELSFDYKLD